MSGGGRLLNSAMMTNAFVVSGNAKGVDAGAPKARVKAVADIVRTEDHITLDHMKSLMAVFNEHDNVLSTEQFTNALGDIIKKGPDFKKRIDILVKKMDMNNNGYVEWDEFCTHFMSDLAEKHSLQTEREVPLLVCPHLFDTAHRGVLTSIRSSTNPARIITASEEGTIVFWSMKMQPQRILKIESEALQKKAAVTDIEVMGNAYRVVVATTNRDLSFYELATGQIRNVVVGLHDMITTLHYHAVSNNTGYLLCGDLGGSVFAFKFTQCNKQLFAADASWSDGITVNMKQMPTDFDASPTAVIHVKGHNASFEEVDRAVKQVAFVPFLDAFVSCVPVSRASLVIRPLKKLTGGQEFHINRGVSTFDFSEEHNLIATGGPDCIVRLWNPFVPTRPMAALEGHITAISHLAFNRVPGQVITLSTDDVIRIWDVREHVCLNTLSGLLPRKSLKKIPISCMLWYEPTQSLLTGSKDELCVTQLSRHEDSTATVTSHPKPLTCMHYMPELGHLITACAAGVINVWDVSSGQQIMQLSSMHGDAAITGISSSPKGLTVLTAASNGSLLLWNAFSGAIVQEYRGKNEEFNGVSWIENTIFACGALKHSIHAFKPKTSHAPLQLHQDPTWKPRGGHTSDVLTIDHCAPNMLATGDSNGQIIVWNTNLMKAVGSFSALRTASASSTRTAREKLMMANTSAVDQVLFLASRQKAAASRRKKVGFLVSAAHAGWIHFWNVYRGELLCKFRGTKLKTGDQGVHCLCRNPDDTMLVSGDVQGHVVIWNIADFCLGDGEVAPDARPRQLASWKAHAQAITAIQLASECAVLTASSDCSVRVWNMAGDYIGTFGDGRNSDWVLQLPVEGSIPNPDELEQSVTTIDDNDRLEAEQLPVDDDAVNSGTASPEPEPIQVELADRILGLHLEATLQKRTRAKGDLRQTRSDMDFNNTQQDGFLYCNAFKALDYRTLDPVSVPREPSASTRSRDRQARAIASEPNLPASMSEFLNS
eukprot:TRINITY_DN12148_c1_g1_i1.p2 TRINITY_DN12148_c1_g1~~TRINITY_DN12148_c1_g1_i1.p2  ORF type:complete len:996 (+),score=219.07 TRINITY_DN12148_c1_g1_i1:5156-8143(+)